MRDGRGWHHYSYEHGLAARGIPSKHPLQERLDTGIPKEQMILDAMKVSQSTREDLKKHPELGKRLNLLSKNFTIEEIEVLNKMFLDDMQASVDGMRKEGIPFDFSLAFQIDESGPSYKLWGWKHHPFIEGIGISVDKSESGKIADRFARDYDVSPDSLFEMIFFTNSGGFIGFDNGGYDFHNAACELLRMDSLADEVDSDKITLELSDSDELDFLNKAFEKNGMISPFKETGKWSPIFHKKGDVLEQEQYKGSRNMYDTISAMEEMGINKIEDQGDGFDYYVNDGIFGDIQKVKEFPMLRLPKIDVKEAKQTLKKLGYR